MGRYSFTKQQRLLNSRDYSTVFGQKAIKVSSKQFLMLATPVLSSHIAAAVEKNTPTKPELPISAPLEPSLADTCASTHQSDLTPSSAVPVAPLQSRLGLVIAKKHVAKAVDRNLIKRIGRECFRLGQHELPSLNIVILSKPGAGKLSKSELHIMFTQLFKQLVSRADKLARKESVASATSPDNTP